MEKLIELVNREKAIVVKDIQVITCIQVGLSLEDTQNLIKENGGDCVEIHYVEVDNEEGETYFMNVLGYVKGEGSLNARVGFGNVAEGLIDTDVVTLKSSYDFDRMKQLMGEYIIHLFQEVKGRVI